MRRISAGAAALAIALAIPAQASAQIWRALTWERSYSDSLPLNVKLDFGGGTFDLRPAADGNRMALSMRYDAESMHPRVKFDSAAREFSLATGRNEGGSLRNMGERGEARVELSRRVPADVLIDIGAASATMNLGGLSLHSFHFRTGASQTQIRFDEPNQIELAEFTIDGSAGSLRATGLANARAARLQAQSHLGTIDLDFSGRWSGDMHAEVRLVLASATIRVPRDVGVEVTTSRVLSSFSPEGLIRDGDVYRSANWAEATYKLTINAHSILGSMSIVKLAPSFQ